ncbi:hypothetical protein ACLB2K_020599 [Fragaria x ananassa]
MRGLGGRRQRQRRGGGRLVGWSDGLCLCGGRDSQGAGVEGEIQREQGRRERGVREEEGEGDREQGAGKEGEIQREQGRRAKYRRRAKVRNTEGETEVKTSKRPRSENDPVSVHVKTTPFQFLQLGARLLRLRVRFLRLLRLGGVFFAPMRLTSKTQ